MLTHRGIKANLDKYQAILEMKSLTFVKEVQHLTGRIASLSRFMEASTQKAFPFFFLLKKESTFEWTPKCEATFTEFKRYLSTPRIFEQIGSQPTTIFMPPCKWRGYSQCLGQEDARQQHPIYFISKVLQGPKILLLMPTYRTNSIVETSTS